MTMVRKIAAPNGAMAQATLQLWHGLPQYQGITAHASHPIHFLILGMPHEQCRDSDW